jgi:hypothetical protein
MLLSEYRGLYDLYKDLKVISGAIEFEMFKRYLMICGLKEISLVSKRAANRAYEMYWSLHIKKCEGDKANGNIE